ncbi:hypothetical protein [Rhizobium sp. Leaf386]|uniref:hypothetical protein n=1 Tax=Rhizobium sp. Leaf386 TaxID=1736359 RepID=UPI0012E19F53|nr:hypothetical protein [Rhizobium sp. Leaf386]
MAKTEAERKVAQPDKKSPTAKHQEERHRENMMREAREQYRSFLESINRSSDREIDRAMTR